MLGRISRCALTGAVKTARAFGGGLSLQSLHQMTRDFARSTRDGAAMPVEAIGALA
jgi:hypothetical protein